MTARANAYDMCRIRKKQPGRLKGRGEDAITIERVYNGLGRGRDQTFKRVGKSFAGP